MTNRESLEPIDVMTALLVVLERLALWLLARFISTRVGWCTDEFRNV
jgi:hypothetical protein